MTLTPIRPPTLGAFRFWLMRSRPGEEFVYHYGHLIEDRARVVEARAQAAAQDDGAPEDVEVELVPIVDVDDVANAAWAAYEAGDVTLKQRRLGPRYFAYIARRERRAQVEEAA